MNNRTNRTVARTLAVAFGLACTSASALGGYVATPVGTLGGPTTEGYGLNYAGVVVGTSTPAGGGPSLPFQAAGGTVTDPTPGATTGGAALSISDTGHIAGYEIGQRFSTPGATLDGALIPNLGASSRAVGVNDYGQAVGQAMDPYSGANCPFIAQVHTYASGMSVIQSADLRDSATGNLILGTPAGINDAGQVAGTLYNGHAFLFNPDAIGFGTGTVLDLGTLPGLQGRTSQAVAINPSGMVIGTDFDGTTTRGFLYGDGGVTPLPFTPAGINAGGQVVGTTTDPLTAAVKLFLYDSRIGTTTDLSNVDLGGGYKLLGAAGINASGQILVNGFRADPASPTGSDEEAFLLTPSSSPTFVPPVFAPVPEPASLALLAFGGVAALASRAFGRRAARLP